MSPASDAPDSILWAIWPQPSTGLIDLAPVPRDRPIIIQRMYAEVVVNRPIHHRPSVGRPPKRGDTSRLATYTYRLPADLQEAAKIGHLIQVPLGHSTAQGIIVGLNDSPPTDLPEGTVVREIGDILDPLPVVTPIQIRLARWIAEATLAPLSQSLRLMLPPGLAARTHIVITRTSDESAAGMSAEETAALRLLHSHRGRMRLNSLLKRLDSEEPEAVIHSLAERGVIDARHTLVPPKPAPPRVQYVRLLADDATIQASLPHLGHGSKQADAFLALTRRASAPVTVAELCELAQCGVGPIRALAERGWIEITEKRTLIVALPGAEEADLGRAQKQAMVLSTLLDRGLPVEMGQIRTETGASASIITALEKKGLIQRISEKPVALLTISPERALDHIIELRGAEEQRAVLDALRGSTDRVWVGGLYAQSGGDLSTLRDLARHGLISLHAQEYDRPQSLTPEAPLQLTPGQEKVWQEIERVIPSPESGNSKPGEAPFVGLLHGVTGSGKTEIYLRALEAALAAGRRAIILVPEISLTAQTVRRFEARFPGRVAVIHSQLSMGQRYDVWDQVRQGEADIVIGPRSALFAPISRLGLIVLDEAHDDSYKQSEPIPLPAYHARDAAIALGRLTGAPVLLGSATPDLVTYYHATQGAYHLLELPHRIVPDPEDASPLVTDLLPPVRVVDLRQELRAGNHSIFSRALQEALRQTLDAGEQAILFLNRRGAATFVLCRDCGYVARCPNCEVPLTFHRQRREKATTPGVLICHRCNHREPTPAQCPECKGQRIRYFGLGTERVEATVNQLYPGARLLRWDQDTASGSDHEDHLQAFIDHRADVLIGTQMIAKGLDLPLVTLVGVISADTALHLPDYGASERTFQLLTQVAGRAGRSTRGGRVIVQTYNPEHYAIHAAAHHDFAGFYAQELGYRRQLQYPPFCRLVALRYSAKNAHHCRAEAERMGGWLASEIRRLGLRADLIGPAPCFHARIQGRYRWQVVIRAHDPVSWLQDVALPQGWRIDVDPVSLL